MPHVLATGYLVGILEWACARTVAGHLEPGQTALGTHVDVSHEAPTPPGGTVPVTARLTAVDGRRLTFAVEAHDDLATVSRGTHRRAVVDAVARFADRRRGRRAAG